MFIWSLSHSEGRNSPGSSPNPSVETIRYREKSWNQARAHSDTLTHAHLHMWTQKQQKPKPPKIKDSEDLHTHNNSVWSSFTLLTEIKRNTGKTVKGCANKKVQTMIQNIQVHMMSYRCRLRQHILKEKNYIDELFETAKSPLRKKKKKGEKKKVTKRKRNIYDDSWLSIKSNWSIRLMKEMFHKYYGK